jgi:colanic acid/amylovoran biosynthesis glycosyltransferase
LDFEYHLFGEGEEKERLLFLVNDLGLKKNVYFHGKQSQELIKNYLKKEDLYIQYSEHEGFCNSVLEAQAMGIPCIVTNNSGISESILPGISGIAIDPRNADLLASTIVYMFSDFQFNKSKTLDWIRDEFSLEKQALEFNKFYVD